MKYFVILCILLVPVGALVLGSRGCEKVFPSETQYDETKDENFVLGKELAANGRSLEAIEKFRQVVSAHPDASAEANLEIGLLALKLGKCPTAIYHFERYLSLHQNSEKRDLVYKQIDAAKKNFVRQMMPGRNFSPAESGISSELEEKYKAVAKENETLKRRIEELNRRLAAAAEKPPAAPSPAAPAERRTAVPAVATQQTTPPPAPPRPSVPATHTVAPGDTLSFISKKYYGTSARWREIYEANRVTMSSPSALKPGMVLKLPRP